MPSWPFSSVMARVSLLASQRPHTIRPGSAGWPAQQSAGSDFFAQERQGHVESQVALAVGVEHAARVFHEYGRAAGDPVHPAEVALAVALEGDRVADADVECRARLFPWGDQVVEVPSWAKMRRERAWKLSARQLERPQARNSARCNSSCSKIRCKASSRSRQTRPPTVTLRSTS